MKQENQNQKDSPTPIKDKIQSEKSQTNSDKKIAEEDKKTLDPTHFGDWQIGCRTIDF